MEIITIQRGADIYYWLQVLDRYINDIFSIDVNTPFTSFFDRYV